MARRPQKRTLKTQANIMFAARTLFERAGYKQTSVDEIAELAGCAKGSVFAHFPDKANLLTAVRIETLETVAAQMQSKDLSFSNNDPVQIFLDLLKPWLDLFANDHDFTQIFLNQADLAGSPWSLRLYEVCVTLDSSLEHKVITLIENSQLPDTTSVNLYTQGIQAFFYHVLIGLHSGATRNASDQELLLRGLLTRWLRP